MMDISKQQISRVLLRYGSLSKVSGIGKSKYLQSPEDLLSVFSGKKIMVVDTETTGLYAHTHQITEIAAEVLDGDTFEIIDSYHKKIKLTDRTRTRMECERKEREQGVKKFDVEKCLELQGYDPEDPGLKELYDILLDFYEFNRKYPNVVIVGQNITFDIRMINTALKKIDPGKTLLFKEAYDTKVFFSTFVTPALIVLKEENDEGTKGIIDKIWDKEKGRPSSRLGLILKAFDIEIQGWHGAAADVKSTALALRKILKFIENYSHIIDDDRFKAEQAKAFKKEYSLKDRDQKSRKDFYKKDTL